MRRARAGQKLTGTQVHNFGAFYKASWRANDWMWGRIDGAGWLIQCLLHPGRLRVLRDLTTPGEFQKEVVGTFKQIGWQVPARSDGLADREVAALRDQLNSELAFLGLDADLETLDAGMGTCRRRSRGGARQHAGHRHGIGPLATGRDRPRRTARDS